MKKKYKRLLFVMIIILIVIIVGILMLKFYKSLNTREIKIIDTVENFDYALEDRDTVLYKNIHRELKNNLESDEINYDEYAKTIAKLFIVDLFTLDNKLSTYDVGGVEFVYPDVLDNYKLNVEDTLYKHIETDSKRKQKLPIVSSIDVDDFTKSEYTIGEDTYPSFITKLNWSYEKDYGYDTYAAVTLILKDEKIYVVEYQVVE